MGFSACFGGPMLNILLGVGLSGTYTLSTRGSSSYEVAFSPTLFTSVSGLLALLAATLVFVPLNGYYLTRTWGVALIGAYVVIVGVSVCVELWWAP
jgi:solute carrier family 24 (sodium/potassium/calcium exchanger), member 6